MKIRWILLSPLAVALVLLVSALLISHARAETFPPACFDELVLRWNEFASDSNRHMQTVEANPEKHRRAHEKIDREFAAVRALACY